MPGGRIGTGEATEGVASARSSSAPTLVLGAVTYAAIAHGAFHARELALFVAIIAVALIVEFVERPPRRSDFTVPVAAALALAAWYLVAATIDGRTRGAVPAVALLFALAATFTIVCRSRRDEREQVVAGMLAIGALVALVGWLGVALHHTPWAIEDNGLWRAASTITYANATGGILGALALVALGRVLARDRGRVFIAMITMVLILGLFATASRGAIAAFAVGTVVLVALARGRNLLAALAPIVGAGVAFAALLASMPSGHHAHPVLAAVGLAAGAIIAIAPTRVAVTLGIACVFFALLLSPLRHSAADAWSAIDRGRVTTSSSDRSHELHAALDLARDHPWTGVGPGQVVLRWRVFYFGPVEMHVAYAHDEYVQTLVESGGVGLFVAVAGLVAVAVATWRRSRPLDIAGAGVVAALVMLALHSASDFLWHVPVVPLVAAALIATLWRGAPDQQLPEKNFASRRN